jgi:hypothetical protein
MPGLSLITAETVRIETFASWLSAKTFISGAERNSPRRDDLSPDAFRTVLSAHDHGYLPQFPAWIYPSLKANPPPRSTV